MPQRGWLWQLAAAKSEEALVSGALEPIPTECELIADGDFTFLVRIVGNFGKKASLGMPAPASAPILSCRQTRPWWWQTWGPRMLQC